jgi:hypothetical protein
MAWSEQGRGDPSAKPLARSQDRDNDGGIPKRHGFEQGYGFEQGLRPVN